MAKGDAAHAAQHQHGVQVAQTGTVDKTVLQRIEAIEERLTKLETGIPAPAEVFQALDTIEAAVDEAEKKAE